MGICLDTEANTAAQEPDDPAATNADWKGGGRRSGGVAVRTPLSGNFPMQNGGKVKFDPPKVPVIFVLGGPGSGKVTHCDTLMQEKRGVTHINMMDLLQQYAIGNDMQDFSQLSSKTVTEVLMLEMKMAPAAKAYLVSGYPRSMRDVVEYSEKIQIVNGVILISWRQGVLQKQIDYGAKLGHVVLSLAKMELENFFKNVMPVADYFDQSDMLIAVNGERAPSEVYKDFRTAVLDILGAQENQEALLNGVAGMGHGVDDIPGSIVSVETAPSQPNKEINVPTEQQYQSPNKTQFADTNKRDYYTNPNSMMGQNVAVAPKMGSTDDGNIPPVIFVIGGPGSNKASLCLKAVGINPGWGHISVGRLLRALAESEPKVNTEKYAVKEAITAGEMVPKYSVDKLLETQLYQMSDKRGVLIDGYPRDMEQIKDFEKKYHQQPQIVLLDCSKLQLGRGRLDDTVSSFRRRLELFREMTLPMLKQLDNDGRLTIVDGDTDSPSVQREFERIIRQHIQSIATEAAAAAAASTSSSATAATASVSGNNNDSATFRNPGNIHYDVSEIATGRLFVKHDRLNARRDAIVQDLEDVPAPGVVPSISHHVSLANGHLMGAHANQNHNNSNNINNVRNYVQQNGPPNGYGPTKSIQQQNGYVVNGRPSLRSMLEEADSYPIDSHI